MKPKSNFTHNNNNTLCATTVLCDKVAEFRNVKLSAQNGGDKSLLGYELHLLFII